MKERGFHYCHSLHPLTPFFPWVLLLFHSNRPLALLQHVEVRILAPAYITPDFTFSPWKCFTSNGYTKQQAKALSGLSVLPGDGGNSVWPVHINNFNPSSRWHCKIISRRFTANQGPSTQDCSKEG